MAGQGSPLPRLSPFWLTSDNHKHAVSEMRRHQDGSTFGPSANEATYSRNHVMQVLWHSAHDYRAESVWEEYRWPAK